jgi:hypothetical protein
MIIPIVRISKRELQGKFNRNEGGYPARIGELRCERIYDEPASPKSNQLPGTRSVIDKYYDGADPVMWLHSFIKPDGRLGASGKPDPKRLLAGGVMYYCD